MNTASWIRMSGLVLALLAVGCSNDAEDREDPAEPSADAGLLEPQRQALERARTVEDDLAEAARQQREAIEDNEGGGNR